MAGMGIAPGDYDLDGHLDIFTTHFQVQSSSLYHSTGKGDFDDVSTTAGVGGERRFVSWGAGMFDLDNDGWPDIFYVTGNVYPELERRLLQLSRTEPADRLPQPWQWQVCPTGPAGRTRPGCSPLQPRLRVR